MILLLALLAAGLASGFLLMRRVPMVSDLHDHPLLPDRSVTVIVPARNEEHNLPRLLNSIPSLEALHESIVIDDNSVDHTADIANALGARVVSPGEPPKGFMGKSWACAQGARSAHSPILVFLDADTFFEPGGLEAILHAFQARSSPTALSVLPFAVMEKPYEELSLFFNLLMAIGAGGFGVLSQPHLFGQSLVLKSDLYQTTGGHASVGTYVLENFHFSKRVTASGGQCMCFGGRGALSMRMFPEGMAQLCNSWTKSFADGAKSTDPLALIVSIIWLSSVTGVFLACVLAPPGMRFAVWPLYFAAAAQVMLFARQIGSFRIVTCLLFPIPLLFFFALFARSTIRRIRGETTVWRGRNV